MNHHLVVNKNEKASRLNYNTNIPEVEIVWNQDNREAI